MLNSGWEREKYLTPPKCTKKGAIQHVQVNQFAKTHDIYIAHSLDQAYHTLFVLNSCILMLLTVIGIDTDKFIEIILLLKVSF